MEYNIIMYYIIYSKKMCQSKHIYLSAEVRIRRMIWPT